MKVTTEQHMKHGTLQCCLVVGQLKNWPVQQWTCHRVKWYWLRKSTHHTTCQQPLILTGRIFKPILQMINLWIVCTCFIFCGITFQKTVLHIKLFASFTGDVVPCKQSASLFNPVLGFHVSNCHKTKVWK